MPHSNPATASPTPRVALVTGAGGAIGHAICVAMARAGMHVAAADIDTEAAARSARDAGQAGHDSQAMALRLDVRSADAHRAALDQVLARWGRLDVLVNNAGITQAGRAHTADVAEEAFDRIVDINLKGAWLGMKHAIAHLRGGGCIVNIASVQGLTGLPGVAIYSATKHALLGLTRSAALEYGPQGVRINAVCPGRMDAPMQGSPRFQCNK